MGDGHERIRWKGRAVAALTCLLLSSCGLLTSSVFQAEAESPGGEPGVPVEANFQGNETIETFLLLRAIEDRMYDLSRRPDETVVLQDATFDLEDLYRSEGFPDVTVSHEIDRPAEPGPKNPVRVTFVIDEGPRVTVREMQIDGAASFTRERLLEFWLRQSSGTFGFGDAWYVEDDVRGFATSLRLFYRAEGFLGVDVRGPEITRLPDLDAVDVRIEVLEGERFRIASATLGAAIREALGERAPESPIEDWARAVTVGAYRDNVLEALRASGYPEPTLSTKIERADTAPTISIEVGGEPGRRARVTAIRVAGNERTDEDVILSYLDLDEGDLYNGREIDEALRGLYLSGLFRTVEVERKWTDGEEKGEQQGELELTIRVVEEESKKVELLLGYGSYERFRGKARFEESNLFGTGRAFSVEVAASTRGERGVVSIVDPRLFGTENVLSLSADAFRREEPSFTDQAYGGTVSLQREILDRWTTRVGYTYRKRNGTDINVDPTEVEVTDYFEGDVFAGTTLDLRDSPIFPSRGVRTTLLVDANDPAFGATIEFVRMQFAISGYWPLTDKLVLAARSEQGLLWPGETSARVPLQERFFNGGQNTVRSFEQSELGPKDSNGTPVGGEYFNLFSVEARLRLIGTLEGAAFVDAGNVGRSVSDFGLSDMRYGIGGGLRLGLPIGPVRADVAWNPDRQPGDRSWTFHLSVGYPF